MCMSDKSCDAGPKPSPTTMPPPAHRNYRDKARWFQMVIAKARGLDLAADIIECVLGERIEAKQGLAAISRAQNLKSADPKGEELSREILACENKVYETFLGPQPDVEAWQKLTMPDYLYINFRGVIWTREENANSLESGVVFSS